MQRLHHIVRCVVGGYEEVFLETDTEKILPSTSCIITHKDIE